MPLYKYHLMVGWVWVKSLEVGLYFVCRTEGKDDNAATTDERMVD